MSITKSPFLVYDEPKADEYRKIYVKILDNDFNNAKNFQFYSFINLMVEEINKLIDDGKIGIVMSSSYVFADICRQACVFDTKNFKNIDMLHKAYKFASNPSSGLKILD